MLENTYKASTPGMEKFWKWMATNEYGRIDAPMSFYLHDWKGSYVKGNTEMLTGYLISYIIYVSGRFDQTLVGSFNMQDVFDSLCRQVNNL